MRMRGIRFGGKKTVKMLEYRFVPMGQQQRVAIASAVASGRRIYGQENDRTAGKTDGRQITIV